MENKLKKSNNLVIGLGHQPRYFVLLLLFGATLVPLASSNSSFVPLTPDDLAAPVVSRVTSLDDLLLEEVREPRQPIGRPQALGPLDASSAPSRTHPPESATDFDVSPGPSPPTRQTQSDVRTSSGTQQNQKDVRTSLGEGPNREQVGTSSNTLESLRVENPHKRMTALERVRDNLIQYIESHGSQLGRTFSSLSFPSLEAALLSLAFLTFAVFLIDLVQDLLNGNNSSGRRRRRETEDVDEGVTDLIVLTLSSLDTLSFGRDHPDCGRKLLCHLNRSGWHNGFLGTASNYLVSLLLAVLSPSSGFQQNLDAANIGREGRECIGRYPSCPSILGDLLPSAN